MPNSNNGITGSLPPITGLGAPAAGPQQNTTSKTGGGNLGGANIASLSSPLVKSTEALFGSLAAVSGLDSQNPDPAAVDRIGGALDKLSLSSENYMKELAAIMIRMGHAMSELALQKVIDAHEAAEAAHEGEALALKEQADKTMDAAVGGAVAGSLGAGLSAVSAGAGLKFGSEVVQGAAGTLTSPLIKAAGQQTEAASKLVEGGLNKGATLDGVKAKGFAVAADNAKEQGVQAQGLFDALKQALDDMKDLLDKLGQAYAARQSAIANSKGA